MRRLLVIVLTLWLLGCGPRRGEFEFCHVDAGESDREALRIYMPAHRVLSRDASYEFTLVESKEAKGFLAPMPVVIPKVSGSLSDLPERWELAGYEFTVSRMPDGSPDRVLIHARPLVPGIAREGIGSSSIVYSLTQGVQEIHFPYTVAGTTRMSELFSCGTGQLHASSF